MLFHVTAKNIDNFVELARNSNMKILFDLNILLRHGKQYNPVNANNLIMYVKKMNYQHVFNFELGNGKIHQKFNLHKHKSFLVITSSALILVHVSSVLRHCRKSIVHIKVQKSMKKSY